MMRHVWLIITIAGLISGCATAQKPKFQFPAGTRVGVINYLEGHATYRHFSSLRIGSFSKKLEVDWNIPAYVENELIRRLREDLRYEVVPLQPTETSGGKSDGLVGEDRISGSERIDPESAAFLKGLAEKHRLDVVVILKTFRGPSAFTLDKHSFELEGYGIFAKTFLLSSQAYAYANIAVTVFKARPLVYLGTGEPHNKKSPLKNFALSGDSEIPPQSEINRLRPMMQEYANQAITDALADSNLIATEQEF